MKCEKFGERVSEFIDEDLGLEMAQRMENHARYCPACREFLNAMWQVRLTLQGLREQSPAAGYKLRLSNRLQEAFPPPRRFLPRSLA